MLYSSIKIGTHECTSQVEVSKDILLDRGYALLSSFGGILTKNIKCNYDEAEMQNKGLFYNLYYNYIVII